MLKLIKTYIHFCTVYLSWALPYCSLTPKRKLTRRTIAAQPKLTLLPQREKKQTLSYGGWLQNPAAVDSDKGGLSDYFKGFNHPFGHAGFPPSKVIMKSTLSHHFPSKNVARSSGRIPQV